MSVEPESGQSNGAAQEHSGILQPIKQKKKPIFNPNENHGRLAANEYKGCPVVPIAHETLKAGMECPDCKRACLHGKLYALAPKVVVLLAGSPLITGTRYEVEKLRCSLCGTQFVAKLPENLANRKKYDETCRSTIPIGRYYCGK